MDAAPRLAYTPHPTIELGKVMTHFNSRRFLVLLAFLVAAAALARAAAAQIDRRNDALIKRLADSKTFTNVGVAEFAKLRADKKNVVLDVRTPKEYADGHIAGAVNLDFYAPDFEAKVAKLDKDKTYLVHCAAGVRSAKACDKMGKLNFPKLYNLEGGFKAWEKAGKEVEK